MGPDKVRKFVTSFENLQKTEFSKFIIILEDPKDLIRKCLVVDPAKRITVRECLKHPFFNTVVSTILILLTLNYHKKYVN